MLVDFISVKIMVGVLLVHLNNVLDKIKSIRSNI